MGEIELAVDAEVREAEGTPATPQVVLDAAISDRREGIAVRSCDVGIGDTAQIGADILIGLAGS